MLNRVTIMGRFVKDPEVRYTNENTPVVSFCLACDRDYVAKGADRETDFIDCTAWRSVAAFIGNHFTKGTMACVSGRLQIRDWTDKQGNKRRSAEIVAENIYFCEKKQNQERSDADDSDLTYEKPAMQTYALDDGEQLPF